ncbi:MAG: AbiV family abortive infection protein [Roseovarius sp.]|nr:AbiV family abortive infection protein [Roseovarius sp.]
MSASELVLGMVACRENARELLEEADILISASRHARAYALLYTACEELGKFSVLELAAARILQDNPPNWKRLWQRFRSHDSKAAQLEIQIMRLSLSHCDEDDFPKLAETLFGNGLIIRNSSLYVDLGPDGQFRKPSNLNFDMPLPVLRALTVLAISGANQRGDTASDIEAQLKCLQDEEEKFQAEMVLFRVFERARDSGISRDKMTELVERHLSKSGRAKT